MKKVRVHFTGPWDNEEGKYDEVLEAIQITPDILFMRSDDESELTFYGVSESDARPDGYFIDTFKPFKSTTISTMDFGVDLSGIDPEALTKLTFMDFIRAGFDNYAAIGGRKRT